MSGELDIEEYKIIDIADSEYEDKPIHLLDFKRHLKRDVALTKKIIMLPNGRPKKVEYTHNSIKYAEISFEFTDSNSLMTRRVRKLSYVKKDNSLGSEITIEDRHFDLSDLTDGAISVQERVSARSSIVSGMKAFLSGVIMKSKGISITQVIDLITPFWDECFVERHHFVEFGKSDWKEFLQQIDLSSTNYDYLATPVDANGTKVRDYMVGRLDY